MNTERTRTCEAGDLQHGEITEQIIGASFEVYRVLGYGFLEKVYQRALQVELQLRGVTAELEPLVKVDFKGFIVGDFPHLSFLRDRPVATGLCIPSMLNPWLP